MSTLEIVKIVFENCYIPALSRFPRVLPPSALGGIDPDFGWTSARPKGSQRTISNRSLFARCSL